MLLEQQHCPSTKEMFISCSAYSYFIAYIDKKPLAMTEYKNEENESSFLFEFVCKTLTEHLNSSQPVAATFTCNTEHERC